MRRILHRTILMVLFALVAVSLDTAAQTLSLNTIHVHRNNIMRKLGIHKQAELVRYALKEGIAQL